MSHLLRSQLIVLAVTAVLALPASAQDTRIVSRLDARTASAVTRLVDSARARSLPTEPLVQKALQGSAKRAPSDRVIAAVNELLSELGLARAALGVRSTEAELVAGAGALHAGVSGNTLSRLRASRGAQSVTVALATLSDLIGRGVPVEGAMDAILSLASRGASDAEFLAFSAQVGRDIAAGAPPGVAARVRSVGAGASAAVGAVGAAGAAGAAGTRPVPPTVRPGNPGPPGSDRPGAQIPPGRP